MVARRPAHFQAVGAGACGGAFVDVGGAGGGVDPVLGGGGGGGCPGAGGEVAAAIGVVAACAALSRGSSSATLDRTLALLTTGVPVVAAPSVPVIVIVPAPPAGSVDRLHESTAASVVQVKSGAATAVGVNPEGIASRTSTFVAGAG